MTIETKDAVSALTEQIGVLKHQLNEREAQVRQRDEAIKVLKDEIKYLHDLNASKTVTIECQAGELLERVYNVAQQQEPHDGQVSGE